MYIKPAQLYKLLAILLLLPLVIGANAGPVRAVQNCSVSESQSFQNPAERTLLDLINDYRAQNSVAPLTVNSSLNQAAAWLSYDMATRNVMSHTDSLGRDTGERLRDCGYNWMSAAENVFPNSSSPQAVFDGWKNSSQHNANMLDARYKEAGIGQEGNFWTLDLGSTSSSTGPTGTQPTITPSVSPTNSPTATPTESPTPTPTPSIILNPTDTKINLNVKFTGIGQSGNKNPKHLTRPVAVGIYNLENKLVLTGNGYLKYDGKDAFTGTIHLGQLPNGTYYVKVASTNTLVSLVVPQFQTLHHDQPNVLPQTHLVQGDLDYDNTINLFDFTLALVCFQLKDCPIKDMVDFNDDGQSNVIDYNLFLASFRRFEGD